MTADWHASEEDQQDRRLIATEDKTALDALVDWAKAKELLDGVPGAKAGNLVRARGRTGWHHAARGPRRLGETRGDSVGGRLA